jgi:hypothetical protein
MAFPFRRMTDDFRISTSFPHFISQSIVSRHRKIKVSTSQTRQRVIAYHTVKQDYQQAAPRPDPTSQPTPMLSSPPGKQLPEEIVLSILDCLRQGDEYGSLATVARANQEMYDRAIPTIYETVVINKRNRRTIGYGHSASQACCSKHGEHRIHSS